MWYTVLLECGIVFHSVFIGMALASHQGSGRITLWIANFFHQISRGIFLGSQTTLLDFGIINFKLSPWSSYSPLVHRCGWFLWHTCKMLNEHKLSRVFPFMGLLNSISAGLLIYAELIQLSTHVWVYGNMVKRFKCRSLFPSLFLLLWSICPGKCWSLGLGCQFVD